MTVDITRHDELAELAPVEIRSLTFSLRDLTTDRGAP